MSINFQVDGPKRDQTYATCLRLPLTNLKTWENLGLSYRRYELKIKIRNLYKYNIHTFLKPKQPCLQKGSRGAFVCVCVSACMRACVHAPACVVLQMCVCKIAFISPLSIKCLQVCVVDGKPSGNRWVCLVALPSCLLREEPIEDSGRETPGSGDHGEGTEERGRRGVWHCWGGRKREEWRWERERRQGACLFLSSCCFTG